MGCGSNCAWAIISGVALFIVVGIPIIIFSRGGSHEPVFTVESAAVKAYNLTSDNRLFCIFDFAVRGRNPNGKHSVKCKQLDLQVRKGKHHMLADDVITPFKQPARNDTVVAMEAVGLYVQLQDKIAAELRADWAAGATTVNIFFSGSLGWDNIQIKCRNVKVYFADQGSSSAGDFVKVGCHVDVYDPNANA